MTYCMFENTSREMHQCISEMREAMDEGRVIKFIKNMSKDEKRSFDNMIDNCRQMMEVIEELTEEQADEVAIEAALELRSRS